MKKRKGSWLRWMGILELLFGIMNILSGGMSIFVLCTQGNQILVQIQAETGIAVTMQSMMTALLVTLLGGIVMFASGLTALMFTGKQGREQILIIMGFALLAYLLLADVVNVLTGTKVSVTMLIPFLLHGIYLLGAYKNKTQMQTEAAEQKGMV